MHIPQIYRYKRKNVPLLGNNIHMSIITTGKNVQNNIDCTSQIIKNGCKTNK